MIPCHRQPNHHHHNGFPGEFRIVEHGSEAQQSADAKDDKRERWLLPASSATTAPTTPRRMSVLRSSRSDSGSMSDERRGCHAIIQAQPTARVKLRKSRRRKSGWANCWMLCWIDSHELPCGSVPPVVARLEHLFRRIAAENRRRQRAHQRHDGDGAKNAGALGRDGDQSEASTPKQAARNQSKVFNDLPLERIACAVFIRPSS